MKNRKGKGNTFWQLERASKGEDTNCFNWIIFLFSTNSHKFCFSFSMMQITNENIIKKERKKVTFAFLRYHKATVRMLTFFNSFEFSLYKLLFLLACVCVCGSTPKKNKS